MPTGAEKWIWENSRASNGSLIVLLVIANECGEGEFTDMRIADLAAKARLSDKGARNAVKDLERLGELSVTPRPGGSHRYALCMTGERPASTLAETTKPDLSNNCRPVEITGRQKLPDPLEEEQVNGTPVKTTGPEIPDVFDLGSVVSGGRAKTKRTSETPRPDVDRLCEHLADRIEANGSRRPNVTQRWRTATRLLLDNDGRTEEDVHKAIDWCQQHHFWLRNIRSMEKLREQYDRLRLDALAEQKKKSRPPAGSHQPTPDEFAALRSNWANPLDAQEAGNDTRGNGRPDRVHSNRLPAAEDQPGHGGRVV